LAPTDYTAIWPRLRLLSCWADGPSAPYAAELARRFPGVTLQPKGLLATEAFVSLPLVGRAGAALSTAAHFFELLADSGEPRLAHQVEKGATYSVVVTTGGGFYRYQLHDVVEVVGFVGEAPCLRFVGKTDQVSDWFGEKLNERFVAGVLRGLFERHRLEPSFALLAPERASGRSAGDLRYALYLEIGLEAGHLADPAALTAELDRALSENFHYAYCRRLGQLAPPRIAPVVDGQERYLRACQRQGQKMGNVKPSMLQKTTHWSEWLGAST
ncbi:MAG: GH3 auxin-responsive promoter family protein, partial [Thermoanaerobaculia bacterium]